MTGLPQSWWGSRFIEALERFTDAERLGRGRSYARGERIADLQIASGQVSAQVTGNVSAYFGADKAPIYSVTLALTPIALHDWEPMLTEIGSRAGLLTRLLLNELPDEVETLAAEHNVNLLPVGPQDFSTDCDCPDYVNPCKHIAGVCYQLAALLDHDPLLLFELRGLKRDALRDALLKTPLGSALAASLASEPIALSPDAGYYPLATFAKADADYASFWNLPAPPSRSSPLVESSVTGAVLKRGGDQPAFWPLRRSFIETMDALYERVRRYHRDLP